MTSQHGEGRGPAYVLDRTPPPPYAAPAASTPAQQAVVDHAGGPLLVLAGPGTGKTTTLVEAVAARVEPRRATRADPRAHLQPQGRRRAARPDRRAGSAAPRRPSRPPGPSTPSLRPGRAHQAAERRGAACGCCPAPSRTSSCASCSRASSSGDGLRCAGRTSCAPGAGHPRLRRRGPRAARPRPRARPRARRPGRLRARRAAAPTGRAAADFLAEYLDVLDCSGVLDYAELVHRARCSLEAAAGPRGGCAARYDVVFVDEYQDTDPAQERLLAALAGGGRDLVVVGDPDQSIYAFRGADVRRHPDFPDRFPRGRRRAGAACRAAGLAPVRRRAAGRVPPVARAHAARRRLPAEALREHRDAGGRGSARARVEVCTCTPPQPPSRRPSPTSCAARTSRTAALGRDGGAGALRAPGRSRCCAGRWSPPACRSRSPATSCRWRASRRSAPLLAGAAGVPRTPRGSTPRRPAPCCSRPLGGDAADLRRLGRALRDEERARLAERRGPQPLRRPAAAPAAELVRDALAEPERLVGLDEPACAGPPGRAPRGAAARGAASVARAGGAAEEALWSLWDGTPLAAPAGAGRGRRAARRAHRRPRPRRRVRAVRRGRARRGRAGGRGRPTLPRGARGPADPRRHARRAGAPRPTPYACSPPTAPRAWSGTSSSSPTSRRASGPTCAAAARCWSADRLGAGRAGRRRTAAGLLAEERRLFYVAVTRARERLVVTAVDSPEDDGDQPSPVPRRARRPGRPSVAEPPRPPAVPARARRRAARTAVGPRVGGRPRAAAAAGSRGLADGRRRRTAAARARRPPRPLVGPARADPADPGPLATPTARRSRLSGSSLAGSRPARCTGSSSTRRARDGAAAPRWASVRGARARRRRWPRARARADLDASWTASTRVWDALAFEAPLASDGERAEAREALDRFLLWHAADRGRTLLAASTRSTVDVAGRSTREVVAARLDGPRRGRRRRARARRRPQDRQAPPPTGRGRRAPPARRLPARACARAPAGLPAEPAGGGAPSSSSSATAAATGAQGAGAGAARRDDGQWVDDLIARRGRGACSPSSSPRRPATPCRYCAVPPRLPGARRGPAGGAVTSWSRPTPTVAADLDDAACGPLGAVHRRAAAPRSPPRSNRAVVVAGAGSGKTTVMAARVVWLVGHRRGAPRGGPRAHLHQQGRRRAGERVRSGAARGWRQVRRPSRAGDADATVDGEPTVSTYHAYAGRLAARPRPAHRRRARRPAARRRDPLPARRAGAAPRTRARSQHLDRPSVRTSATRARPRRRAVRAPRRRPATCAPTTTGCATARARRRQGRPCAVLEARDAAAPARRAGAARRPATARRSATSTSSTSATRSRSPRARPRAPRGRRRPSASATAWCCSTSTRTPRVAQRYAHGALRRRPPGHRRRRPLPGHLRLARRLGRQHRRLPRPLPAPAATPAGPAYPLDYRENTAARPPARRSPTPCPSPSARARRRLRARGCRPGRPARHRRAALFARRGTPTSQEEAAGSPTRLGARRRAGTPGDVACWSGPTRSSR